MTAEILDRQGDRVIERLAAPDAAYVDLLNRVVWGFHGLRYRRVDFQPTLARWPRAQFHRVVDRDKTVAVFTLVPRVYDVGGVSVRGWYRSTLAVDPDHLGGGLGKWLTHTVRRVYLDEATSPTLLFGFVERDNARSLGLQKSLGYTSLASLTSASMGSLWPKPCDAQLLTDRTAYLAALATRWRGYELADFDQSLVDAETWVRYRAGRLVAGCQVVPHALDVRQLAGVRGKLLMAAAPHLTAVSPLFSLHPHKHLWIGSLYWDGDDVAPLRELIDGMLHRFGVGSAVAYLDPRGSAYAALARAGFGVVHHISPNPTLVMMAGHRHLSPDVLSRLENGPLVFSPLDGS